MRSHAHFKAHPIHPALIPFPFAFLEGALLFDVAGVVFSRPEWGATASHLTIAGIVAGLLAAVPGIIDYFYTVPPNSSGKNRARKHGVGNVIALGLFGIAWMMRTAPETPSIVSLVLEGLGGALLAYTGYLGGTLVTRNMVSVDHRYANAGKWKEQSLSGSRGEMLEVADVDELEENQMKLLRINGRRIALARTAEGYKAFDDRCTHRGGSLAGGVLIDGTVQCLWHGSQFDAATGEVSCGPAKKSIKTYRVEEKRGKIWIAAPQE